MAHRYFSTSKRNGPTGVFAACLLVIFSPIVFAETAPPIQEHQLVRRAAVFPIKMDESASDVASLPLQGQNAVQLAAEEAWWAAREEMVKNHRFVVASKIFLQKNDAFQPRGDLDPADALILGKVLDAHALITMQVLNRKFLFTVYDGLVGVTLWRRELALHPSLTVKDQLAKTATNLVKEFIAGIPYHGFTTVDPLIGRAVFDERQMKLSQIELGSNAPARIGDVVQWIKIGSVSLTPVFQGGAQVSVFAEGKIIRLDASIATVEIARATSLKEIQEFTLVRLPGDPESQAAKLRIGDHPRLSVTPQLLSPEAQPMKELVRERKPLVATLSSIGSVIAYLLLAF